VQLVHEYLLDLVEWIQQEVVILIDDLDRCQAPYVVELLEGIQTLFRDVPITYVIADRDWLPVSYAKEYDRFESVTEDLGRPAGYLFLEQTFQISAPSVSRGARLDTYWGHLLRSSALPNERDLERARVAAKKELGDRQTREARRLVKANPGTTPAEVQARRETVAI
jgi:hypothetical protein